MVYAVFIVKAVNRVQRFSIDDLACNAPFAFHCFLLLFLFIFNPTRALFAARIRARAWGPCVPLDCRSMKSDAFRFRKIEKQVEDLQSAECFDDVHRVILAERVLQSFFLQRFNAEDCRPFVDRHRGAAFFRRGSAASQQ